MKKTLALVFAIVMVISSCLPVGAITLETVTDALPETVVETPVTEDANLTAAITTPETAISQYGKLILYKDFEQDGANMSTNAYLDPEVLDGAAMQSSLTVEAKYEVVDNPDQNVGGKVLDISLRTGKSTGYHVQNLDWDDSFVANGDFRVVFDAYSDASFAFVSAWNSWSGQRNFSQPAFTSNNTWVTASFGKPYTVSVDYTNNEYGTFTHGYTSTVTSEASAENRQPYFSSYGGHYGITGNVYIDNVQLWYFPKNSVLIKNAAGEYTDLVEFDATEETFMLPATEGVTGYTNGIEFYDVNYPVSVSEFYGKNATLTPVNVSFYDDAKGELAIAYDFENGYGSPYSYIAKYINGNYYNPSTYNSEWSNGYVAKPEIVEAGTGNHAIKQITPAEGASHGFYYSSAAMAEGVTVGGVGSQYTIDFNLKAVQVGTETVAESYPAQGSFWFNGSGDERTKFSIEGVNFDTWLPVSFKHTVVKADKLNKWAFSIIPTTGYSNAFLIDDFAIYFFPTNKIHIKESAASSKVYTLEADENGNVVVPTKEELGLDHLEGILTGFAAADGTTLVVGSTVDVKTYAAKTYYPVLETIEATFVYGNVTKTVSLNDSLTYTMPNLSALSETLTDVENGAWLLDNKTMYDIGEVVDVTELKNKTLTFVNIEVNSNEYGKLIYYMDFENENSYRSDDSEYSLNYTDALYAYINEAYISKTRVDSRSVLPYFKPKGSTTRVENPVEGTSGYVLKIEGSGYLDAGFEFSWSAASPTYVNRNGKYTMVYDVYTDTDHRWNWAEWRGSTSITLTIGQDFTAADGWTTYATPTAIQTKKADGTYKITAVKGNETKTLDNSNNPMYGYYWYSNFATNTIVYFDNVRIYYAPAVNFECRGEVVPFELGQDATVTMPALTEVFPDVDANLLGWKVGETVYEAGATVAIENLVDANVTAVLNEYYVTFNGEKVIVAVDTSADTVVLPALAGVDEDWTDAKAYLVNGVLKAPGETVAKASILGTTVTAIAREKLNEFGTLIALNDFEQENATLTSYAYYDSTVMSGASKALKSGGTVEVVDKVDGKDEAGNLLAGNGKAIKVSAGHTVFDFNDKITAKNAELTFVYDAYLPGYTTPQSWGYSNWITTTNGGGIAWHINSQTFSNPEAWTTQSVIPVTQIYDAASGTYTYIIDSGNEKVFPDKTADLQGFMFYGSTLNDVYLDNYSLYYKAPVATFTLRDDVATDVLPTSKTYTLPKFETIYPDSDAGFIAWNIAGTLYAPGDVVDTSLVVLNDVVATVKEYYVAFDGVKGVVPVDTTLEKQVLPELTSVNSTWTNAKSYVIDGNLYVAGDEIATDKLLGNTFTVIDAEAFSVENGILLAYYDFEQGNKDTALYVNAEYNTTAKISTENTGRLSIVDKANGNGSALYHNSLAYMFWSINNSNGIAGKSGTVKFVFDANLTREMTVGHGVWRSGSSNIFGHGSATINIDAPNTWKTYETVGMTQEYTSAGKYIMTSGTNGPTEFGKPVTYYCFYDNRGNIEGEFDNVKLYFYPTDRLYFAAEEGATPTSVVATNGKVTVPTPAALGMNINATHWVSADGYATLEFGAEVDVALYAENVYYPVENVAPVADASVAYNEIRDGIRFKATVTKANKDILNEYGFLFARAKILDGAELTFDFTTGSAKKAYVSEYAYLKGERDVAIETNNNGDTTFAMTAFGIPEANRDETLVARPYAKYFVNEDEITVYGAQVTAVYNQVKTAVVQG